MGRYGKQGPNLFPFGPGFDATGPQSSKIVEESKKQSQAMHMMLSLGVPFSDSLQSGSFGLELSSLYKTLKAPSRAEFSVCFSDGHCTEIGTIRHLKHETSWDTMGPWAPGKALPDLWCNCNANCNAKHNPSARSQYQGTLPLDCLYSFACQRPRTMATSERRWIRRTNPSLETAASW